MRGRSEFTVCLIFEAGVNPRVEMASQAIGPVAPPPWDFRGLGGGAAPSIVTEACRLC